jgi:parallel beta-helix repeat protein
MRIPVSRLLRRTTTRPAPHRPAARLRLEGLEERAVPATFTVTNTNSSGAGSLRQAILNANASPGADTIAFNIGGAGVHVLLPTTALPALTGPTAVRGATQPGFSGSPLIELNGLFAGASSQGLVLAAGGCIVDALSVVGFGHNGIDVQGGSGDAVTRCDLGVTPSGGVFGNGVAGVALRAGASGDRVTGNVLSGNGDYGVMLLDAGTAGNTVAGNTIGLNPSGAAVLNVFAGVYVGRGASANTIGGPAAGDRNVISGNASDGVLIGGTGATGNAVRNNLIGVGTDGVSNRANGAYGVAVQDGASGNAVAGNVVGFNPGAGVLLDGTASNSVRGNLVGISSTGSNIGSPAGKGIWVKDGSANNTIAGNTVGNNGGGSFFGGVQLEGAGTTGNVIQGNTLGLTAAGAAAPNGYGVLIEGGASGNTVGGASAALRNVISANLQADVGILDAGTSGNVVESNFLGTNAAGTAAAPQQSVDSVAISGSGNRIGGVGVGNVISGNSGAATGILIGGSTATGNVVQGNKIGTNAAGTAAIPNAFGVIIQGGANHNLIGGTATGAGNIISGNTSDGVFMSGAGTADNVLQGNRIGHGVTGQSLSNGIGVLIANGANHNLIGGTAAGAGNVIADNTNQGVVIGFGTADTTTVGNAVVGNSIFGNGGLGIDLANDGVTANTPGGPHSGPNQLQNTPVLNSARLVGGDLLVRGTLNGQADTTFRVELFASAVGDPSGHGEGQFFLGYTTVTTDSSGNGSFAAALSLAGTSGVVISATATAVAGGNTAADLTFGDTSEFSNDFTAF